MSPICYSHYKKVGNYFNNSVTKRQKMTRIVNLWYLDNFKFGELSVGADRD